MAESARLLRGRGLISDKAWASKGHPAGTTSERSKMAKFHHTMKDEGKAGKGAFDEDHIEDSRYNDKGLGGGPSKGGKAGMESKPTTRGHINKASLQMPHFPKHKGGGKKWPGVKGGGGKTAGPMYGGPNNRSDG